MILLKQKGGKRHDKILIGGVESFIEIHLLMQAFCVNIDELLLNLPVFKYLMEPGGENQFLPVQINGTVF